MKFNEKQREKLSDFFMDLSKGLFLASFTSPIIVPTDIFTLIKLLVSAILCLYFSLFFLKKGIYYDS